MRVNTNGIGDSLDEGYGATDGTDERAAAGVSAGKEPNMSERQVTITDGDILVIREVIDVLNSIQLLSSGPQKWATHIVKLMMLIGRYEQAAPSIAADYADSAE